MSFKFRQLLEERKLVRIKPIGSLSLKRLKEPNQIWKRRESLHAMEISNGLQFKDTIQFFMLQERYSIVEDSARKATMLFWLQFKSFSVMSLNGLWFRDLKMR
jgi:hypothetical protein